MKVDLIYQDGPAGFLTEPFDEQRVDAYAFMPYRSKAHAELVRALTSAPVEGILVVDDRRVAVTVRAMTARTITIAPSRAAGVA